MRRRRPEHRERAGTEVVQLYLSDPVAPVVRPARWLATGQDPLEPGEAARVGFQVHADRTSFTGPDLRRMSNRASSRS